MKKKILLIALMLSVCISTIGCEEQESIYNENESIGIVNIENLENVDPQEFKIAIYNTYKTSVTTYKSESSYSTRYSLVDIDKNGIPELIYNTDSGRYKVYSYDGKILVYSGGFKSKHEVYTHDGMLFATSSTPQYFAHAKISLDETFKIFDIGYPYLTAINDESGNPVKFTLEKEEITEEAYNSICSSMKELETYSINNLDPLELLLK